MLRGSQARILEGLFHNYENKPMTDQKPTSLRLVIDNETTEAVRLPSTEGLPVVLASEIKERVLQWVWYPYIAKGCANALSGDGGIGKSQILISLTAIITTGSGYPDENPPPLREPRNVVLFNAEDDPETVLRPRLRVSGADLGKVVVFSTDKLRVLPGGWPYFNTPQGLEMLENILKQYRPLLVGIDPITGFAENLRVIEEGMVRGFLSRLTQCCVSNGATPLYLMHWSKQLQRSAAHQGLGSVAFTNYCRSVITAARDPENKSTADQTWGVVAQTKTNLVGKAPSRRYCITGDAFDRRVPSKLWWGPQCDLTADQLVNPAKPKRASKLQEARAALDALIKQTNGEIPGSLLSSTAARLCMNYRTVYRAAQEAGLHLEGRGENAVWRHWST